MAEKISAVYKITNTVTGDFYVGSSKNVKKRWREHKCKSTWKEHPNNPMYQDMEKYGVDKFEFQVIAEVEPNKLKEIEQEFIETLKPAYNDRKAKGRDIERQKNSQKKYEKSDKYKEYKKSDKFKESRRKASNKYLNQLCYFNGQILTLHALSERFRRKGIPHPVLEAKKYLI